MGRQVANLVAIILKNCSICRPRLDQPKLKCVMTCWQRENWSLGVHHNVWKAGWCVGGLWWCWELRVTIPTWHFSPRAGPVSTLGWLLISLAVFSWVFERVLKSSWCICQELSSAWLRTVQAMWGWDLFCSAGCLGGSSRWKGQWGWREGGDGAEEGGSEKNQG